MNPSGGMCGTFGQTTPCDRRNATQSRSEEGSVACVDVDMSQSTRRETDLLC